MAQALVGVSGTHTVTTSPSLDAFTTSLLSSAFDLAIFFEQYSGGPLYDAAWTAMAAHIAGGGAAIGADWTSTGAHAAAFNTGFITNTNNTAFTVIETDLLLGITNPVSLLNPGWGIFSNALTPLAGGTCAATFSNGACAIVVGNNSRTKFNGFLDDTFVHGPEGVALYVNEINEVLGVPEPGTLSLAVLALAGLAMGGRRRRR
jgi:hypothetical protein